MTSGSDGAEVRSVRVSSLGGRVTVVAEKRSDVAVTGGTLSGPDDGTATVTADSGRVEVRVPTGVDLAVGTHGGRVDVKGPLGAVAVVTESGRIAVARAESADVRTTSGRVRIGRVAETARVRSSSGRVTVDHTGGADVATDSGRIDLRSVTGRTAAHCVSGRITVRLTAPADVEAETVSGRITIHVARGVEARAVTGPLPAEPQREGADCVVATRSVSGRVTVTSP